MDGTTQLLLLLGTMRPSSQQQQGDPDSAASVGAAAVSWPLGEVRALHSSLALQLVGHLLQQSLERIARLRESALINLHTLLQQPAAAAAVPGAAAIAAALPADAAELAGVASLACVSRLGALLLLPWYRSAVLEGLAASIGGVDAALAKEASATLLAQVGGREGSSSSSYNSSAEAAMESGRLVAAEAGSGELRGSVAELLLQLWKQETGWVLVFFPVVCFWSRGCGAFWLASITLHPLGTECKAFQVDGCAVVRCRSDVCHH
jgi:hypothetical protein